MSKRTEQKPAFNMIPPAGHIWKLAEPYRDDKPEYDCCIPTEYAGACGCYIGDVWICNEDGELDPDYSNCAVPVSADNFVGYVGPADEDYI